MRSFSKARLGTFFMHQAVRAPAPTTNGQAMSTTP